MRTYRALLLILVAVPSAAAAQPGYHRQMGLRGDTVAAILDSGSH